MLSKFDYVKPEAMKDALAYLAQHDGTKILAGGTDLMIMLRHNAVMPEHILDIKAIPELKRMEYKAQQGLFIGAAITVNETAEARIVQEKYPALAQAANSLASYQLRNRATVVGNICNASPGADLSGPLLVYEAKVHLASQQNRRIVDIAHFFTGVKKTILQPDEIVLGISLPEVDEADHSIYLKQARIRGHDLGIVGVAVRLTAEKKCKIAMSAVAPTPVRLTQLEEMIDAGSLTVEVAAKAGEKVHEFIKPISDVRSSAAYRLHAAGALLTRALVKLQPAGGQ